MVEIFEYLGAGADYNTISIFNVEEPKEREESMIFEYKTTYVEVTTLVVPTNVEEPDDEMDGRQAECYDFHITDFTETPVDLETLYPNEIEEVNEDWISISEVLEILEMINFIKPTIISEYE